MMKKENAGAATFCPRRRRSLWPAEKGIAQKHAERCIGQRSALHTPSQRTAFLTPSPTRVRPIRLKQRD